MIDLSHVFHFIITCVPIWQLNQFRAFVGTSLSLLAALGADKQVGKFTSIRCDYHQVLYYHHRWLLDGPRLRNWRAEYVIYYKRSDKKLVYEQLLGYLTKAWYTVEVHVPEAKSIVFGTTGSHQLLLDLKHDDRLAVNLGREYFGLTSRPTGEYKFTNNFADTS